MMVLAVNQEINGMETFHRFSTNAKTFGATTSLSTTQTSTPLVSLSVSSGVGVVAKTAWGMSMLSVGLSICCN
jgi:hypothetical protein